MSGSSGLSSSLPGSWEAVTSALNSIVKPFFVASGLAVGEDDWIYLVATFPDYVITQLGHRIGGTTEYYKVSWEMQDGKPTLMGQATRVEIENSSEVVDLSLRAWGKQSTPTGAKLWETPPKGFDSIECFYQNTFAILV